jgi:SAM-dependent methyltransferase
VPAHKPVAVEDAFVALVDALAPRLLGRDDRRGAPLAQEVAHLSELYTRDRGAIHRSSVELAARLRFFLLRDLAKVDRPLAELGWRPRPVLRVLDLGAGLGTSTLGVSRACKRHGIAERMEVLAVERAPRLLDVMKALTAGLGEGALAEVSVPVSLSVRELDLEHLAPTSLGAGFDLVVIGLALNELFVDAADPIAARAAFCESLAPVLAPGGVVLVIEPALRETTRALMALRDRLEAGTTLCAIAPCTARGACPLLRRERDWCHADDDLALPPALAAIAKGAGLRWEGLSYAYLTLARERTRVTGGEHRVVGGPIETKGRTEWHLCRAPSLVRLGVLHRDEAERMRLEPVRRGDRVVLTPEPAPDATVRTPRDVQVALQGE